MKYEISIESHKESHQLGIKATFERINVLLGANGAGKSNLIRRFRQFETLFGGKRPIVFVEGGRAIQLPNSLALSHNNIDEFRDLEAVNRQHYGQKKLEKLADRIQGVLIYLAQLDDRSKISHSNAISAWEKSGRVGELPLREEPYLERLFKLFHNIFPDIKLEIIGESQAVKCRKGTAYYHFTGLSDGERQVLALLADVAILSKSDSLILVDEPELNLHPQLAIRLWDFIEATLPNAVFIYGTHSLAFAMRSNVDRLIILGGQDREPVTVDNIADIPSDELRQFLGAIPAILAYPGAIVVEGEDASFDTKFYDWIVGKSEIIIVPVGSCNNVLIASKRTGVWETLAPNVTLVGIIDRDFRSEKLLDTLKDRSIIILDLHEAESYFCYPVILHKIIHSLGIVNDPVSEEDIQNAIITYAKEKRNLIIAKRVSEYLNIRLGVSISRSVLEKIPSNADLTRHFEKAAKDEINKSAELFSEFNIKKILTGELNSYDIAVTDNNLEHLLSLIPGKELLNHLLQFTGCNSTTQVVLAAKKHIKPSDFAHTRKLHSSIISLLKQ